MLRTRLSDAILFAAWNKYKHYRLVVQNKETYSLISIRTANSILWSVHNKNKVSILKKIIFKIYKPAYNYNTTAKE